MNIKTAKMIAEKRHKFPETYFKEFFNEWKGSGKWGQRKMGSGAIFWKKVLNLFFVLSIMEKRTRNALKWIIDILSRNNIPYRIGGGVAVCLYGLDRVINDIDISISGKYFSVIIPFVKKYIIAGPKHYKNDKWDCDTLSLSYDGQEIDLTDVDTLLMSKKDGSGWIRNKEIYQKYSDVNMEFDGVNIVLMNPQALIEYKKELEGEKQETDINFLRRYIGLK